MLRVRSPSAAPILIMKIAHVLGNGPSRKDFVNEPFGDIYGCNLSDFDLPLKATFIMDAVCVNHIRNERVQLPWPVIVCTSHVNVLKRGTPKVEIMDIIYKNLENGESTGHYALRWCASRYDEVHVWGFDSMWQTNVDSDSHVKIPTGIHCDGNYKAWRRNWDKVINEYPKCNIILHKPAQVAQVEAQRSPKP